MDGEGVSTERAAAEREVAALRQGARDLQQAALQLQRQAERQANHLAVLAVRLERGAKGAGDDRGASPALPIDASGVQVVSGFARTGIDRLRRTASGLRYRVALARSTWQSERDRMREDAEDRVDGDIDAPPWEADFEKLIADCRSRFGRDPAVLDWHTGLGLGTIFPGLAIFAPPTEPGSDDLPYLDRSIDLVVVPFPDRAALAEAHRVAVGAVATLRDAEEADDRGSDRAGDDDGDDAALTLDVEWLPGSPPPTPRTTSIVIPTYNGVALTVACLAAVQSTVPPDFGVEIVVVDDGSTDDTWDVVTRLAKQDDRIKPVRNETNRGFIDACNRGASVAEGEILLFLNNDTEPEAGWLPPLLGTFRNHPAVGAVGAKLVYPDGRLQEAGAVVFRDGSGANFGRGDDPDHPLFNYVRDVDYCSGAVLATERSLFREIGGFDARYRPAYYEDTDYCLAVRQHGFRVLYQPDADVIHHEGGSSGGDLRRGAKRYQAINRRTFVEKWGATLVDHPPPPDRYDRRTWYALAVRGDAGGDR